MYEVYVLKSLIKNWYYVGLSLNKNIRFKQHNNGQVQSTKAYKPFNLIFSKAFNTRIQARDYEKFLKIRSNKEKFLKHLNLL